MDYESDIGSEDDDIFIDTVPVVVDIDETTKSTKKQTATKSKRQLPTADESIVDNMLSKAVVGPDFDQKPIEEVMAKSNRAKRKQRKVIREMTKGEKWYNMPATELTDENRRDLELLQMRAQVDPKARYKKNDLEVLPKYFQTGTVLDNPADFYSSRLNKKQRKHTMVDELMHDQAFLVSLKKKKK
ncbi:Fcf2 domain-containing protein [Aphelenchoides bicaudatus]|nr:Fcf2 domain-containing protein [Aphelenchoides bicaudatus]